MLVRDIMQPKVVTTAAGTLAERAFEIMRDGGFRHLPIVDDHGALIGIVSDRDLLGVGVLKRNQSSGIEQIVTGTDVTVASIMVTAPITVAPDTTVSKAVKIIRDKRIGCLVVCRANRIVGILSYMDILAGAEAERNEPQKDEPDLEDTQPIELAEIAELRVQLAAELRAFEVEDRSIQESEADRAARAALMARPNDVLKSRDEAAEEAIQRAMDDVAAQLERDKRS